MKKFDLLLLPLPQAIFCIIISSIGSYYVGRRIQQRREEAVITFQNGWMQNQNHHLSLSSLSSSLKKAAEEANGTPPVHYNNIISQQQQQQQQPPLMMMTQQQPPPSSTHQRPRSILPIFKDDHYDDKDEDHQIQHQHHQHHQHQIEEEESIIKKIELLVHPAMFVHDDPEVIVVMSSSNNSPQNIERQVHKHTTVEDIYVIDTHQKEQKRLLQKLLKKKKKKGQGVDVVLIQEEDGNTSSSSSSTFDQWYKLLADNDGIIAIQLQSHTNLLTTVDQLQKAGFQRIIDYSISSSTNKPSSIIRSREQRKTYDDDSIYYLMAFTTTEGIAEFHQNEALWNVRIHDRLSEPLQYIDSSTMIQIEYPSKRTALLYCATTIKDEGENDCLQYSSGFDDMKPDIPYDKFMVAQSLAGEHAGRGVFALEDIPLESYTNLARCVHHIPVPWQTTEIIQDLLERNKIYGKLESLFSYIDGYGYVDEPWGQEQYFVETDLSLFVNHGCNGTFNVGWDSLFTEQVSSDDMEEILSNKTKYWFDDLQSTYNPMQERRINNGDIYATTTIKPIKAGDEILENYLAFDNWENLKGAILQLQFECNGGYGFIEEYQEKQQNSDHAKYEDAYIKFDKSRTDNNDGIIDNNDNNNNNNNNDHDNDNENNDDGEDGDDSSSSSDDDDDDDSPFLDDEVDDDQNDHVEKINEL